MIDGPPGAPRVYSIGRRPREVARRGDRRRLVAGAGAWPACGRCWSAGARIGELRILTRPPLNRRDALMLNAYGDALAASLHDAATNSELRALTERSTTTPTTTR